LRAIRQATGDHLDFDIEAVQPRHADHRGRGKRRDAPEFLGNAPDALESRCGVDDEDGHVHHIVERATAGSEDRVQVGEGAAHLRVEFRFRRPVLAAADLAGHEQQATGPHRGRIAVLFIQGLAPRRKYHVTLCHRFSPWHPGSGWENCTGSRWRR
jgi:hypothetical protein